MKTIHIEDTPKARTEALKEVCWQKYYNAGGNEAGFALIWPRLRNELMTCFATGSEELQIIVHGPPHGSKYRRADYEANWDVNDDEPIKIGGESFDRRGWDKGREERP